LAAAAALAVVVGIITSLGNPGAADRIVFVAEADGSWDLWWMNGDGSRASRLTTTPLDERAPSLSPDRSRVAYSTSDGALWILDTATRNTTQVPLEPGRYSNPTWAPNNREIVFTAYTRTADGEDATLWKYEIGQAEPRELLRQDGAQDFGDFSPDGQTLTYSSSGAVTVFGFGYTVIQQLWTLSLVTGRVQELVVARGKDTQPSWSPDGRAIVFVSDRGGVPQLWRMNSDGTDLRQLTTGPNAHTHPSWSPGGDAIVFTTEAGGRWSLATIGSEGGKIQPFSVANNRLVNVQDPHWR
jgi:TolB protein